MASRKILVVEDELITRTDLKFALEDMGHEVIGDTASGEEAVRLAASKKPELVLMDIHLNGEISGIDASKMILNMGIPVVYLTANADDETFEEANVKPASGFLTKPFDNKKLERAIDLAVNRQNLENQKIVKAQQIVDESETKEELLTKLKDVDEKLYEQAVVTVVDEKSSSDEDTIGIFIVEDEQITALDLKLKLEDFGYNVLGNAATGEDAIKKINETRPDLVLMDITLQGNLTGIDVTKSLESLNIPIIYLTANTNDTTIDEAIETGPYGYVSKPFNDRELQQSIELALSKHDDNVKQLGANKNQLKDRVVELDLKHTAVLLLIFGSCLALIYGFISSTLTNIQLIIFIAIIIICIAYLAILNYRKNKK